LFLFSGVFFPVTRLPEALQTIAAATPLYHGVELTRGFALRSLTAGQVAGHAAYLTAMLAIGATAAVMTFRRKLRQ
jgi:lipooligosaccharide transport system permease protein